MLEEDKNEYERDNSDSNSEYLSEIAFNVVRKNGVCAESKSERKSKSCRKEEQNSTDNSGNSCDNAGNADNVDQGRAAERLADKEREDKELEVVRQQIQAKINAEIANTIATGEFQF